MNGLTRVGVALLLLVCVPTLGWAGACELEYVNECWVDRYARLNNTVDFPQNLVSPFGSRVIMPDLTFDLSKSIYLNALAPPGQVVASTQFRMEGPNIGGPGNNVRIVQPPPNLAFTINGPYGPTTDGPLVEQYPWSYGGGAPCTARRAVYRAFTTSAACDAVLCLLYDPIWGIDRDLKFVLADKLKAAALSLAQSSAASATYSVAASNPQFAPLLLPLARMLQASAEQHTRAAQDPPDFNYTVVSTAQLWTPTYATASNTPTWTSIQRTYYNNWVDYENQARAYGEVFVDAANKMEGARIDMKNGVAGADYWLGVQKSTAQSAMSSWKTATNNVATWRHLVWTKFWNRYTLPVSGTALTTQDALDLTASLPARVTDVNMQLWVLWNQTTTAPPAGYWPQVLTDSTAIWEINDKSVWLNATLCATHPTTCDP